MPETSPATTKYGAETVQQFGYGPFGQLMANLGVIPTPLVNLSSGEAEELAAQMLGQKGIIDLRVPPSKLLNALRNPTNLSSTTPFWHGVQSWLEHPGKGQGLFGSLLDKGLTGGWFSEKPFGNWGPSFMKAEAGDIPQPMFLRKGWAPIDPPKEYAPTWLKPEYAKDYLDDWLYENIGKATDTGIKKADYLGYLSNLMHGISRASLATEEMPGLSIPSQSLEMFDWTKGDARPEFNSIWETLKKMPYDPNDPDKFWNELVKASSRRTR